MSRKLRSQYLELWTLYPSFDAGVGVRFLSVCADGMKVCDTKGTQWTLRPSGETWDICLSAGKIWQSFSSTQLVDLFVPGDWLIVDCDGTFEAKSTSQKVNSLLLAAPNLLGNAPLIKATSRDFDLFVEDVRKFFIQKRFFPARTPSLVVCPGMEPALTPFQVNVSAQSKSQPLFLPTSPELHLKQLMCMGYGDLFEIKRVYRNELSTRHHQPEFLMLEWYRNFANLDQIHADITDLIEFLLQCGWSSKGLKSKDIKVVSLAELFQSMLGFPLTAKTSHEQLLGLANDLEVGFHAADDSWDDTFFKIFLSKIEPELSKYDLLILKHYPPSQAALARLTSDGWADRMEFYICGMEVGNAFNELNDPELQLKRFQQDQQERKQRDLMSLPIDRQFLRNLNMGLPPSAGIAIGLERLFMGLVGEGDISSLSEFAHEI